MAGINTDVEIQRLENMIREGIKPRIAGIRWKTIDGFANGPVLLGRIQKSFSAPHMIIGSMKDEPAFDEVLAHGRAIRQADRPDEEPAP